MKNISQCISFLIILILVSCNQGTKHTQPVYRDIPYLQDYAIKYIFEEDGVELKKAFTDYTPVSKN